MKNTPIYLLLVSLSSGLPSSLSAADLSPEQVERKKSYFEKFDLDGDGSLSINEFIGMTEAQFRDKERNDFVETGKKRFARNDLNGDGKVTFQEWLADKN